MSMYNIRKFASFCLMAINTNIFSQIILHGIITDNGSDPVINALVELTDQTDTYRKFTSHTGEQGQYFIQVTETGIGDSYQGDPGDFNLLQNYPNPFNPSTVIFYKLSKPAAIRIEIYNILGQKIKTLFDGFQPDRSCRIPWDATDDLGRCVPAGIYICSLEANGIRINKKMSLIDGLQEIPSMERLEPKEAENKAGKQMSNQYRLRITGDEIETYEQPNILINGNVTLDITVNRTVTDIDGNVYRTVKIGDQWWMAENLNVTRYRNGDSIINVTEDAVWCNLTTGAYCNFNNNPNHADTYGRLYNWYSVVDPRGLAPTGWHAPNDAEWKELEMFLGMSQSDADAEGWRGSDEGGKMKEVGTTHWRSPNNGATNESGFTALPAGTRFGMGWFFSMGGYSDFWSPAEAGGSHPFVRHLINEYSNIARLASDRQFGCSVRCIRGDCSPNIPTLSSPSNGATGVSTNPTLIWKASDGADSYGLQISTSPAFESFNFNETGLSSTSYEVTGLAEGTVHYWRVNAANDVCVSAWSADWSFTTSMTVFSTDTVKDIEGNVYRTVKIGNQWWMAENLKVTRYRNDDAIPNVIGNADWANLKTGAYCNYENNANLVSIHGRLYNWYAANDDRNIAPPGWHVPSDEEWKTLEKNLGMSQSEADAFDHFRGTNEGGKLKEAGTAHWNSPNTGATNESGFSALPSGYRINAGHFYGMGNGASYWTSTEWSSTAPWVRDLSYDRPGISRGGSDKQGGISIRCVRDN